MSADLRSAVGRRAPSALPVPHVGVSAAFLAEVRAQRVQALDQLEQAAASLDDWALSAARGRLRDLEEILDRNDAGRRPRRSVGRAGPGRNLPRRPADPPAPSTAG